MLVMVVVVRLHQILGGCVRHDFSILLSKLSLSLCLMVVEMSLVLSATFAPFDRFTLNAHSRGQICVFVHVVVGAR